MLIAHDICPGAGFVGGSVPNALHVLVGMVSSLHLPNGSIAVEGFYE